MEQIKKKCLNFPLLTAIGLGALTMGCSVNKINEPLDVSERGKQECLKRSDLGKNAFTAKQIYNKCLTTIDELLVQQDAFDEKRYYERQRKVDEIKQQKAIENQKLKSELSRLKAEKEKLKQEKRVMAESRQTNIQDQNDCKEGSIIGGVLGAGLTMSSTKGKDRWWAVPLGATAGSLVGCQIDGG
tara:strand:+ start:16253 stop:16810 length:558 start_codon:yes stop_codon:yes gene_type:complete